MLGAVAIFGTFGRGIQKGEWARGFRRHLAEHFARVLSRHLQQHITTLEVLHVWKSMQCRKEKANGKERAVTKEEEMANLALTKARARASPTTREKASHTMAKGFPMPTKDNRKASILRRWMQNTCSYCGKTGHWQKDCYKRKTNLQVRQVEEDPKDTAHTTGSSATSATAVRMVSIFEPAQRYPYMEDLTVFSQPSSSQNPFRLCAIFRSFRCLQCFTTWLAQITIRVGLSAPDLNLCDCFGVETFSRCLATCEIGDR